MSISPDKLQNLMQADNSTLKKSNKDELCNFITILRSKFEELQSYQMVAKRVQLLEKNIVSHMQYNRRESVEIHGFPETITDRNLEEKSKELLEEIGCGKIKSSQIHACHRMKNKNVTIIRFVNRKTADNALHNRAKLKNIDRKKYNLEQDKKLYINESLCRPMQYLSYKVRCAYKAKKIVSFNMWKGKLTLKVDNEGEDISISHVQDLIDIGLACEDDKLSFFKLICCHSFIQDCLLLQFSTCFRLVFS